MWDWIKKHWWPNGGVGTNIKVYDVDEEKANKIKNFFLKLFKIGDK